MKRIVPVLISIMLFSSCGTISTIKRLNTTEVQFYDYKSDDKSIRFVEMIHIGKKEFYENVRNQVEKSKKDGYVLFYEYIDFDQATDEEKRKTKKMAGFVPSPEGYERELKSLIEKGYVTQKNELFLNLVNNKDFNVDITPNQLIEEYEKKYGEIILTSEDLNTPIDEKISPTISKKNMQSIVLDYRNNYLAAKIEESSFDKIIILYGAQHRKGLIKELQKLNPTWDEM